MFSQTHLLIFPKRAVEFPSCSGLGAIPVISVLVPTIIDLSLVPLMQARRHGLELLELAELMVATNSVAGKLSVPVAAVQNLQKLRTKQMIVPPGNFHSARFRIQEKFLHI